MENKGPQFDNITATMQQQRAQSVVSTTNNNNNANVRSCAGCGVKIMDRFLLHALDRYWHTGCLKCTCCGAQLGELGPSCFSKGGMILCKKDYLRLFGNSGACSSCGQSIPASELVMRAQGNVYHQKCFACTSCHNQLVPGDRFLIVNGNLFCETDHLKILRANNNTGIRARNKVC
ncbi:LIM domain transcription factor LMO4.2-like isoform X2 [Saccoglossus kowalevskii]